NNGGSNNTYTNNIIDLGNTGSDIAFSVSQINQFQPSNLSFHNNVIVSSFTGNQNTAEFGTTGWTYYSNGPGASVQNNAYFNTAGGQVRTDGNVFGDSSPVVVNPQIIGPLYQLANGSPIYSGPIDFKPIVGGW